jgi:hypothetical protein
MSKFMSPEKEVFDRETPNLKSLEYGSDEYKQALGRMKVALDHHYANNSHHPEHYENGMAGMSLLDLMEMLADWKAATERHETGDITKSIDLNAERFGYDEMMRSIFHNTISEMGWEAVDDRFARSMTSGFSRRVWDGDFNTSPEPEYNKAVRDHVRSDYLNDADLVIAHLWREAMKPDVIEAVQSAMDGPVLSWSTGDLKPGTAEQITVAMLTALIGPRPQGEEAEHG